MLPQFYETTVVEENLAVRFVIVPARCLGPSWHSIDPDAVRKIVGADGLTPIRPGWLLRAVATCLASENPSFISSWPNVNPDQPSLPQNFLSPLPLRRISNDGSNHSI